MVVKLRRPVILNVSEVQKCVLTLVMVLWWLFCPLVGFNDIAQEPKIFSLTTLWQHTFWMVSHANFWHLAGNIFVLWVLPCRLNLLKAFLIAFICSFLPGVGSIWEVIHDGTVAATCGFSGVLFAIIGIHWGVYCAGQHKGRVSRRGRLLDAQRTAISGKHLKQFCYRVLPFALVGFFIPHLNWTIHLYCLTAGLIVGMVNWYNRKYIKA